MSEADKKGDAWVQANAITTTYDKMKAQERVMRVSKGMAEHYNKILALAKEACPEVGDHAWPPPIEFAEHIDGALATQGELAAYAKTIVSHTDEPPGIFQG